MMFWEELTTQQLADYLLGMSEDAAQGIGSDENYEAETYGILQELKERGEIQSEAVPADLNDWLKRRGNLYRRFNHDET